MKNKGLYMLKKSKLFILIALAFCCVITSLAADERIYVDDYQLSTQEDFYHIHIGNNIWIKTQIVHKDIIGLYALESDVFHMYESGSQKMAYERTWKCPYCHHHWAIGQPCQNPLCPSRYR